MATIDELRASADDHARQLEAVHWLTVKDLVVRWGVSAGTIRQIDRARLPYLLFGQSQQRRYDPDDVLRYEAEQKRAAADHANHAA